LGITVAPPEGLAGQEFTFTGWSFTPHGLVHDGFIDPHQVYHYHGSFYTNAHGGFVRTIASGTEWLLGVYTYTAFDATKSFTVSVQFTLTGYPPTATPTPTPGPMIAVTPNQAPIGHWFTFIGSYFTPHGPLEEQLVDADGVQHSLGAFEADGAGGFVRLHRWTGSWPTGTYAYMVYDVTKHLWASVGFEMIGSHLSNKFYAPMVVKNY